MSGPGNAPIIIKRKKVSGGDGHHGGAWKVAYADFVTAMMAFFLLMWLLGATTEKQRKSIADYFSPTIPMVRASGGGSGAFGGESMFSQNTMSRQGTGSALARAAEENNARGATGTSSDEEEEANEGETGGQALKQEDLEEVQMALLGIGGESMQSDLLRRHIVTRLSDEGLVIELFDAENAPLFLPDGEPSPVLDQLLRSIVPLLDLVENDIAARAHSRSLPIVMRDNDTWAETSERAEQLRTRLEAAGLSGSRVERVTGFADRKPATRNPMDPRNDRLEIVLLRRVG